MHKYLFVNMYMYVNIFTNSGRSQVNNKIQSETFMNL